MLSAIRSFLLKKLYRLLIFKVSILPKENIPAYRRLHTYLKININSNKGIFTFNFKRDRRAIKRKSDLMFRCFVVELEVPPSLQTRNNDITDKVLVVIKIVISPIDYKILSEVLIDLYLDTFLKNINK